MSDRGIAAVDEVLDDVDADDPDELGPEDVARLEDALPTDPQTARVVSQALPFPWSEVFEYVSPSDRQSGYWRVKPDRSRPRSAAEAETRQKFGEASAATQGVEGVVERDGKRMPATAAYVAERMEGTRATAARARVRGKQAFNRLRDVLDL